MTSPSPNSRARYADPALELALAVDFGGRWYERAWAGFRRLWNDRRQTAAVLVGLAIFTGIFGTLAGGPGVGARTGLFAIVLALPILMVSTLVYFVLVPRLGFLGTGPAWRWYAFHGAVTVVIVTLGAEVGISLLRWLPWFDDPWFDRLALWQIGMLLFGGSVLVSRLRTDNARSARLAELAAREALTARFQALQARLNPHFLFNNLNSLAGLIEEDPARAVQAVETLASLLRYTLEGSQKEQVPLREELSSVEGFLALEKLRYGERLRYSLDCDPTLLDESVPPLSLQPIVENAVLHGVAGRTEGGTVQVALVRSNAHLVGWVEDDGPGRGRSPHRGTGTALDNLRTRLALLYGDAASLALGSRREGGGFRVEIRIPLDNGARVGAEAEGGAP